MEESVDTASGEPEPTQMAKSKSVDMGSPKSPSAKVSDVSHFQIRRRSQAQHSTSVYAE